MELWTQPSMGAGLIVDQDHGYSEQDFGWTLDSTKPQIIFF